MTTATVNQIPAADLRDGDQIVRHTGRISQPLARIRSSVGTFGTEMISFDYGVAHGDALPAVGVRAATDVVAVVRVCRTA